MCLKHRFVARNGKNQKKKLEKFVVVRRSNMAAAGCCGDGGHVVHDLLNG